jgi:hypothetical protein
VLVELPVLVAVAAKPIATVVVPLIGETNRNAVFAESPDFLDEPVVETASGKPGAVQRLALQALLEQARLPTWRLWARDAAIEKKDVLEAEVTHGTLESSSDRNVGIAMYRTPTEWRRCRGSEQM